MTSRSNDNRDSVLLESYVLSQGWAKSQKESQGLILAGRIRWRDSGEALASPSMRIKQHDLDRRGLECLGGSRFVSRAGEKLDGFLSEPLTERVWLDVGSSTGGFTDCLLQRGASKVVAVDVGSHQLHERLRNDARVELFEKTDIRNDFEFDASKVEAVTVDVSFISLRQILPSLFKRLSCSRYIVLFKPQFEIDRYIPKKRGVAPESASREALADFLVFLRDYGAEIIRMEASVIKGSKGNQETLVEFQLNASPDQEIVPQHVFRTYDIRGHAERDLSSSVFERLGRVLADRSQRPDGQRPLVGVSRDERLSSPRLFEALVSGLSFRDSVEIIDLGCLTTPMAYFALYHFKLDGLFQITASHNPKDDNGVKMMLHQSTLFGDEIQGLYHAISQLKPAPIRALPLLSSRQAELTKAYLGFIHDQIRLKKPYKIVVDCANGMAGTEARRVFSPYAKQLEILFENVDCTFPNHEADPTVPSNLRWLQDAVKKTQSDVGFAFDGDGDRLGVVTAKGRILFGDEILMLLAELVLKQKPGSAIIGEVKCAEKLFRMIRERGGQPIMYKTGHSLIKKKMKELKAPLAGEMSGHLFFSDRFFGFDDAFYAAVRVLEVMDHFELDLDAWIDSFGTTFATPETRVECQESEKASLVERVKHGFSNQPKTHIFDLDGVRATFEDGSWVLVRASNTQAVLVVRIEAVSAERLIELKSLTTQLLGRSIEF